MAKTTKETLMQHIKTYELAKLYYDLVKDVIREIQTQVLTSHEFYEDMSKWDEVRKVRPDRVPEKARRITDPGNAGFLSAEDYNIYLDECYELYKIEGIDDPRGKEYCADNNARNMYYEAEKNMIDYYLAVFMPDDQKRAEIKRGIRNIKFKERLIQMILKSV